MRFIVAVILLTGCAHSVQIPATEAFVDEIPTDFVANYSCQGKALHAERESRLDRELVVRCY